MAWSASSAPATPGHEKGSDPDGSEPLPSWLGCSLELTLHSHRPLTRRGGLARRGRVRVVEGGRVIIELVGDVGDLEGAEIYRLDVTREMFDFMESIWEPPSAEEMAAMNGVTVGR